MNIILDSNKLAFYIGQFTSVSEEGVVVGDAINSSYNTSNTTVIDTEPPTYPVNFAYQWNGTEWFVFDQAAIDSYILAQKNTYNESQKKNRYDAYTAESDPLFFKVQRGQATQQQWLDAIAAIDARFPYQV